MGPGFVAGRLSRKTPSPKPSRSRKAKAFNPSTHSFQKNKLYDQHRGFAFKETVDRAASKHKLKLKDPSLISPGKTGHNLVWVSPDGKRILSDKQAQVVNRRRRAANTLSDAWGDFKAVDPQGAKRVGWNTFQKSMRGIAGSKIESLHRFQSEFGLDVQTYGALVNAADGDSGERNGWGDSG